jgi:hypothetical protein
MNRRTVLIGIGFLLGVTTLGILAFRHHRSEVSVSFVNSEISNGQFPGYVKSERLAFAVRTGGTELTSFSVCEIKDEHGKWVPSQILGHVEAGQIYLYLPLRSHPQGLRIRLLRQASAVQKTKYAFKMLIEKALGRYQGGPVWCNGLEAPACDLIVNVDKEGR